VTEEEFRAFLDEFVTPLFPDGLTVVKADGQFRGADGVTIEERQTERRDQLAEESGAIR
jgi:hypothetical protein